MTNTNYSNMNIGKLANLKDPEKNGKVFIKESLGLSSAEVSFGSMPAKTELPFFHTHKQNEEIYIFIKGHGQYQVDNDVFEVSEGSIVKVSPKGIRSIYNSSDEELIYITIQAKENSLEQYTMTDGEVVEHKSNWKK